MPSFMIWQAEGGKRLQLIYPKFVRCPFLTQSHYSEPYLYVTCRAG